ncbi:MAG TPA: single-stranded DNA-binding protein [Mycobacteriales bacterium]|nr:single-stranded DNA-binding protein [Mycobacteriales bacterium]
MKDTVITVVGNVMDDPKVRRTEKGVDVAGFRVASTARRFDKETALWVDAESLFVRVTVWRHLAANVVDSLRKGDPVLVTGRLFTRQYEKDGQLRSSFELEATALGHDLSRGTTVFRRTRMAQGPAFEVLDEPGGPDGLDDAGDPITDSAVGEPERELVGVS